MSEMTQQELGGLWDRVCERLRGQMPKMTVDNFIRPITPVFCNHEKLVLMIQDEVQLSYVRKRYLVMLIQVVTELLGSYRDIELILEAEYRRRLAKEKASGEPVKIPLNPKYSFDNFVVGSSNRFAHAGAWAAANSLGTAYNPLFIYGGVGLGKTHLMHAIGNRALQVNPDAKVLYITSESFTNEFITAIQTRKNAEFRQRYRSVDLLMIDDIQFLGGRDSTQEEIFHTFNELYQANKQIVISSDKPPEEITMLEERLVSRFAQGLVTDIQKPDFETTVAILRKKAEIAGYQFSDDVFFEIAQHVFSSVREMEGCLNKIVAFSALTGQSVTKQLVSEVMRDMKSVRDSRRITSEFIIQTVCDYFDVSALDIKSQKRTREIAVPRQIAMYLIRDMLSLSLPAIGREFGGRDHTTVMHACDKIEKDLKNDRRLSENVQDLKKRISEG